MSRSGNELIEAEKRRRRAEAKDPSVPGDDAMAAAAAAAIVRGLREEAARASAASKPRVVTTVSNVAELNVFIAEKASERGIDPNWIRLNQALVSFLSGVASARVGFDLRKLQTGNKHEPPRDWPYYTANAIQNQTLDAKGGNLDTVIMAYAPDIIGESILAAYRAIHVAKPAYGRYTLMDFVVASVDRPLNKLAGIFRTLVKTAIQKMSSQSGHSSRAQLEIVWKREKGLLTGLANGCGGLTLESNDCPSTTGR